MTTYPYVPAYFDNLGPRKGPTLGLLYHMAEGGGTVGYLDKNGSPPPRGVSVHAVCEYSGRVVQMLKFGDASGSLNPSDRSTDKAYFGHSILVDVLGDWWRDPNSAVISMEIEGFAKDGPNQKQVASAIAWGLDMRGRYPSIRGAIGHADQTDTKRCPGATPPMRAIFDRVGGHGLFSTEEAMRLTDVVAEAGTATITAAGIVWRVADGKQVQVDAGSSWDVSGTARYNHEPTDPTGDLGYMIRARAADGELHIVAVSRCTFVAAPAPGPLPPSELACKPFTDPLTARLATANSRITKAGLDLGATPGAPI